MVKIHILLSLFLLAVSAVCSYGHLNALGKPSHTRFERLSKILSQNKAAAKKFVRDLTTSTAKNAFDDYENQRATTPRRKLAVSPRVAIHLAAIIANKVGLKCSAPTIMQKNSQDVKKSLETVKQLEAEEKQKQLSTETYSSFVDRLFLACYKQVASLVATVKNFSNLDFNDL